MQGEALQQSIGQARAGDEAALAGIIAQYMPAIRSCAARAVCPGLEFDDAVQEGIIGLFGALESYGEGKGASFSTYAGVCIQNAVLAAVRTASRKKHAPLNTFVPLPETQATPGPEDAFMAQEQYQTAVQSIETRLSALEKQVLLAFLDGSSYSAIAARLQLSEKAVDNALQRVRAKLK